MRNLVNISIDDVSPHLNSSTKVLKKCFEIIKEHPNIKFTLFVPVAYWRTKRPGTITKNPLNIDLYPDFCKEINLLPENNFEIAYHGLYHGIPHISDNDEFQNLSYDDSIRKIKKMKQIVKNAGLENKFKKIFRPPAWRMSPGAIRAFRDNGFNILALSPKDYAIKTYENEQLNKDDIVYYNCNPPFDPLKLYKKTEIVYHACEWDKNYLDSKKTEDLKNFINKNKKEINFSFLENFV